MFFFKYILSYFFAFICITPFSYFLGGWHFVFVAYFSIILSTLPTLKKHNSRIPIITLGMSAGFLIVACMKLMSVYLTSLSTFNSQVEIDIYQFSYVLTYAVILILLAVINNKKKNLLTARFLIFLVVLLFATEAGHLYFVSFFGAHIQFIISGVLEAAGLGVLVFFLQNTFIYPQTTYFYVIAQHIKKIGIPVLFFFIGYFLITFTFSGIYALVGNSHHLSFSPAGTKSITDYIFYSFNISSGLGDTRMVAASPLCQWITIAEIISSLIWLTIIVAAAISYINNSFVLPKKH